jgi:hypothetical protein
VIGEDVSERLDVTPAKFRVIVTRRPKYAYRDRDGVIQAPAPSHLIESGLARAEGPFGGEPLPPLGDPKLSKPILPCLRLAIARSTGLGFWWPRMGNPKGSSYGPVQIVCC